MSEAAHRPQTSTEDWSRLFEERVEALIKLLNAYLEPGQVERVRVACDFAADAHAGVQRRSGEPYVFHPVAVATLLARVQFDYETIMAAILHDVLEDTHHSKTDLAERFGTEIAELVDGVSKLTQINFSSKVEAQAENFRKMFLAMARDIRVIMVKLADRLHNMQTLDALPPPKRRRIARETLEIYAPIAGRLGMNYLRLELEKLGFRHRYPVRFQVLEAARGRLAGHRREIIGQLESRIRDRLLAEGIKARIVGREKHLWGIYKKMRDKHLPFQQVYDVYAVRIIVDSPDTCYRVLGLIHSLYKPFMGRFKDYIAIPKANGYQSLHTVLFGPQGVPIEVQIRTQEMHVMAEAGVAAHWIYKSPNGTSSNTAHKRAREWVQKLLDLQRRAGNSVEFLENVKVDLFPDEVYVFTPRGEIIELPRGATCVDFAYAIHSDVGNQCVGAKVDRYLVPLRTTLQSGQTVEVIIAPTARPNPAWLNFVVTGKARTAIRHYLKHLQREEAVILGKRLLEKALPEHIHGLRDLPSTSMNALVAELRLHSFDDVLADIGLGNRLAPLLVKRLLPGEETTPPATTPAGSSHHPLLIQGTEGAVVSFGKCCRPLPGDSIIGYLSAGRGIMIHRDSCKNVTGYKKNPEKWLEVDWAPEVQAEFSAEIRVHMANRPGVLATAASAISAEDTNIEHISTLERDGVTVTMDLVLSVHNRRHLARILQRLRTVPEVLKLSRRH